eukprot:Platyproteum_vivax@DN2489_c0_g1_i2.p1
MKCIFKPQSKLLKNALNRVSSRQFSSKSYIASASEVWQSNDPFIICVWGAKYTTNCGAIFRNCGLLGAQSIFLSGSHYSDHFCESVLKYSMVHRHDWSVRLVPNVDIYSVIDNAKLAGYHIVCLEHGEDSIPLPQFPFAKHKKIAVVAGSEDAGVPSTVMQKCTSHVSISSPVEINASFNLSHALTLLAWERHRQLNC